MSYEKVGDPTGDDWVVCEFVFPNWQDSGNSAGNAPDPLLRVRGEAGGSAFSDDTTLVTTGEEFWSAYMEGPVLFALRLADAGIVCDVVVDGVQYSSGTIANTGAGDLATMTLIQSGSDLDASGAYGCEVSWFGLTLEPESHYDDRYLGDLRMLRQRPGLPWVREAGVGRRAVPGGV